MLKSIISDNETEHRNQMVENWAADNGITHVLIQPYSPYANGIIELINKTIAEVLKLSKNKPMKKIIKKVKLNLNEKIFREIGVAPKSLWRGYNFFDLDKQKVNYENEENEIII